MNRVANWIGTCALVLAGLGLHANDFKPLMDVVRETWPGKTHIGVICNYGMAEGNVWALAEAAGPGVRITVADTRHLEHVGNAANILKHHWTDYVVLMPNGGVVRDGSFGATIAVHRLADRQIPTLAITPRAIGQGVLFAIGRETNGQLMMGDRLIGVVDVVLPKEIQIIKKATFTPPSETSSNGHITVIATDH